MAIRQKALTMKFRIFLPLIVGFFANAAIAQNQDLGEPLGDGGEVEDVAIEGEEDLSLIHI